MSLQLHAGQVGAEAEVRRRRRRTRCARSGQRSMSKRERIVEHLLVAVGRDVPDDDLVALLDLLAVDLGVGRGGAAEVEHRRRPAQDLLDRAVERAVGVVAQQPRTARGSCMQRPHAARGGVAGGLVAGDREQQHEHVELELGELVAVDLGVDQLGDDVVARVGLALLGELVDVHVELGRRVCAPSSCRPRTRGRRAPIMRFDQSNSSLRRSSCGTPMISAIACSGSSAARSIDEVARAALDDVVDDEDRAVLQVLLEQPDHPRREALVDQQAVARVLGRIHVEHHQAAGVDAAACSPTRSGPGCSRRRPRTRRSRCRG